MVEIKFRAWDSSAKRWVPHYENMVAPIGKMSEWAAERGFVIMQYTGLKDKHGLEIYEGDIVSFQDTLLTGGVRVRIKKREVVKYDSENRAGFNPFCDNWDYDGMSFLDTYGKCEVIGNIYENPDLLKQQ